MSTSSSGPSAPAVDFRANDLLPSTPYKVLDILGKGQFGQVVKCVNTETLEVVAVKISHFSDDTETDREVEVLQTLKELDLDMKVFVNIVDYFKFDTFSCIALELLDCTLWDFLKQRNCQPLSLNEIRPVVIQMLMALQALHSIGIVHSDLKPDNIMLVDKTKSPISVKMIDFGLALKVSELKLGMACQPIGYAAPEVMLGLEITEAIDMWGLGCLLAFLYSGKHLLSTDGEYESLRSIIYRLGHPENGLIDKGLFSDRFFTPIVLPGGTRYWTFKTPIVYSFGTGKEPKPTNYSAAESINIDEFFSKHHVYLSDIELEDRKAFVSLVKQLLCLDPTKRISPSDALKHDFVTMKHLIGYANEGINVVRSFLNPTKKDSNSDVDRDQTRSSDPGSTTLQQTAGGPQTVPTLGNSSVPLETRQEVDVVSNEPGCSYQHLAQVQGESVSCKSQGCSKSCENNQACVKCVKPGCCGIEDVQTHCKSVSHKVISESCPGQEELVILPEPECCNNSAQQVQCKTSPTKKKEGRFRRLHRWIRKRIRAVFSRGC